MREFRPTWLARNLVVDLPNSSRGVRKAYRLKNVEQEGSIVRSRSREEVEEEDADSRLCRPSLWSRRRLEEEECGSHFEIAE